MIEGGRTASGPVVRPGGRGAGSLALARAAPVIVFLAAGFPARGGAQVAELESACRAVSASAACAGVAEIVDILMARSLAIAEGGNPVPGTASTLGYRRQGVPRVGLSTRFDVARIAVPDLPGGRGEVASTGTGWSLDAAVGVFEGFSPWPTVGGVASVDLIGSVGLLQLPSSDGFRVRNPSTWALGARVGILRESFTAPGLSVSGMIRRLGPISLGDRDLATRDSYVRLNDGWAWSTRFTVGKRIALAGMTAGAGYTSFSADATVRVPGPAGGPVEATDRSFTGDRFTLFGNAAWTWLVFTVTGEAGWQSGGDALTDGRIPSSPAGGGGLYLGLAGRLTI